MVFLIYVDNYIFVLNFDFLI